MGTPAEIQRSLGPQAPQKIQKVQKTSNHNVKSMACQACYARKKRCVVATSQSRCTYCCREGQDCVPRERQHRLQKRESESQSPSQSQSASPGSPHGLNFRLPHGIDHEVPRWAAVYSMFSEVLRLIPSEMNDGNHDEEDQEQQHTDDTMIGPNNEYAGDSITSSTSDDMKTYNEPLGSGFSLGELDALLRF